MILDRLTLEGFRLHRRTEMTFGPGLTAIVGANGAGKSTLLESVSFALFGEQRGTRETLRGDDGGPYRVRLEFRIGNLAYTAERRPDKAFLAQGERKIAEGLTDTSRACARLLGLNYEQFRNSFLAEQKGLAFLRFRNAAARQQEVGRMLGLDRLRAVEGKAADARRAAGIEAKALESAFGDERAIRAAYREAEASVKEAGLAVQDAEAEVREAQAALANAVPAGEAAEAYLGLVARVAASEEALRLSEAAVEPSADGLGKIRDEASEAAKLVPMVARYEELRSIRPGLIAAQKAAALAESLEPGGSLSIADAAANLSLLEKEFQTAQALRQTERGAAKEALRRAEADLQGAQNADGDARCPVCGRPLGEEAHQWKGELEARVAAAKGRVALAEALLDSSAATEVEASRNRLRAAEARSEAARLAADFPEGLAALEAEFARLAPFAERARALAGAERRLADAEAHHARTIELRRQALEAAHSSGEALRATGVEDAEAAQAAVRTASAVRTSAQGAYAALRTAESNRKNAESVLKAAADRNEEAEERRETLRAAKHAESLNGAVATEMRALRTALNGAIRPELESRAGELLDRMTAGRYRRLRLSADFEPTLIDDDIDRAILSGGEEDVVALALRLALAELVQDRQGHSLTLLMLDEAFGALDADRRQSLLDVLTGLRDRYDQVIVVSHVEDVTQVADRVLRVTRDETGAARVTEI